MKPGRRKEEKPTDGPKAKTCRQVFTMRHFKRVLDDNKGRKKKKRR